MWLFYLHVTSRKILSKVYVGEMNNSAKHDRKHKLYRNLDFLKQYITVEPPYATIYRKRPLTHSTKTFPVKSLQLETFVNDHLSQAIVTTFLDNGFVFSHCLYPPVSDHLRHDLICIFAVCTTLRKV